MFNSCEKEESSQLNAEIIGFNSYKCGCCWGWIIKLENEIIKADKLPDVEKIGYEISTPIPVILELGECKRECPGYDYYDIISLKRIN